MDLKHVIIGEIVEANTRLNLDLRAANEKIQTLEAEIVGLNEKIQKLEAEIVGLKTPAGDIRGGTNPPANYAFRSIGGVEQAKNSGVWADIPTSGEAEPPKSPVETE